MNQRTTGDLRKLWRYSRMYGLPRALTKAAGRLREGGRGDGGLPMLSKLHRPRYLAGRPEIGLVGCGQFAFSTIAWFLSRGAINPFLCCYDPDRRRAESLAAYYGIPRVAESPGELYEAEGLRLAYVASNHASHTDHAVELLRRGVDVYCEKPVSVNREQFGRLREAVRASDARFYAGYNRPFSGALADLRSEFEGLDDPRGGLFTLNCHVSAEDIPPDHWYREPGEGTRICGNAGHWLDLMVHCHAWRGELPDSYGVRIAYSDSSEPDDNISLSLTTGRGDLCVIVITARSDPFEGINETINFHYGPLIAKIDDFRAMQLWKGEKRRRRRYRPKDVGHRRAILRPPQAPRGSVLQEPGQTSRSYRGPRSGAPERRPAAEVFASTELMLGIAEMVREGETEREIALPEF